MAVSIESIAPFILAPFLTHYLSVYEYGVWAIFQAANAFLRPLLGLALDDYVRMHYHHNTRERMVGYMVAIILISGLLSLLVCAVSLALGHPLSELLHFPQSWLWSIIACSWLHAMFYMLLTFYQFESNRKRFALIHLVQALATLGISVALVMGGWGWSGAVVGKILGLACGTLLAWVWIARLVPESVFSQFQRTHLRELFSFSWRYLPSGMAVVVIILTNRLMLANEVDVQAASLFAVASLFPMVLLIAIHGYVYGWQPWCFTRLARKDRTDIPELAAGAGLYLVGLPIGGFILSWGANWLGPYVIDPQFHDAFAYVFPLSMAMVAQGYYAFAQSILQFYQQLAALSWIACIIMAANVALNFALIAQYGTIGSCWAMAITYAIGFVLVAMVAAHLLKKHYFTKENARV
ncbi:MAG: polysaccharide biosynthesis C-terminal domain-containing protein [Rickettsiales bacterium]|nr:polysaccharide biosynthesis C-terminal domain-containing protein [Rickettsiales bacterium]